MKGVRAEESRMVSTAKEDFACAAPGSALAEFTGKELSDHNAVWAMCCLDENLFSLPCATGSK